MNQERLKIILATMSEYVYHGYIFPMEIMKEMHQIYCSTCGSCGELDCCPPNKCKFGLKYINELNNNNEALSKELLATRQTLSEYIKMMGFTPTEKIIGQEIEFHGKYRMDKSPT